MKTKLKLSAALCLLVVEGVAEATVAPRFSLEEMVERSERIVQGRSVRTWSAWDAERQFIWTHSEIQVSDPLKGARVSTVVVSEPGGSVDGVEMLIEGVPHYQPGDEMVLFLYRTPIGLWRARGMGQGKYKIWTDPQAGSRRVRPDLGGVALVDPAGAATARGTDLRQTEGMPLEEFKSRVRGLLARPERGTR